METKEEQDWRMMHLPNGSVWPCRQRKKSKTGEDGSYQTAQVGRGDGGRKKSKTGEDSSLPHTSDWPWRQRKKEEQKLDLIWIEIGV